MYDSHDRASTQRIVLTIAGVVAVVAAIIAVAAFAVGLLTTPYKRPAPQVATIQAPVSVAATRSVEATPAEETATPEPVAAAAPIVKPAPKPAPAPKPSASGIVVIDAGHQGKADSSLEPIGPGATEEKPKVAGGATGVATHNPESLVNLQVALKLERVLEARGVKVIMVRTSQNVNISNSARAKIANDAHADLFIRLHCDGIGSSSTHGLSTLVPAKNRWTGPIVTESAVAGKLVHRAVIASTGAADRGVVGRSDLAGFNWSTVPTVLVEMGFLSNPSEDRALGSAGYQQKLADGMANGVVQYLKSR